MNWGLRQAFDRRLGKTQGVFSNGHWVSIGMLIFSGCFLWTANTADAASHSYQVSADGTEVTDLQTGLIWRRCAEGLNWDGSTCSGSILSFTAQEALQRAADQSTASSLVWRLPNRKELGSLVDRSQSAPTINPAAFPLTPATNFWTSTPVAGDPTSVWAVVFEGGFTEIDPRQFTFPVRLVRGGP